MKMRHGLTMTLPELVEVVDRLIEDCRELDVQILRDGNPTGSVLYLEQLAGNLIALEYQVHTVLTELRTHPTD